jgi:subtilase family serine protease
VPEDSGRKLTAGPDQVVYILDQGLIRFGKFAAAVLALFITIGLILYGVDVKQTAKDVEAAKEAVTKDVTAANETIAKDRTEAEKTLAEAKAQAKEQIDRLQQQVRRVQDEEANTGRMAAEAEAARNSVNASQQQAQAAVLKAQQLVQQQVQAVQDAQANTRRMAAEAEAARNSVSASQQQAQAALLKAQQLVASISSEEAQARTFVARILTIVPAAGQPETPTPTTSAAPARSGFSVPELAQLYNFPTEFNGRGQKIGLIELGGGFRKPDLDSYFKSLSIPAPTITAIAVDGAKNSPTGDPNGPDGEVELDIEVAGAVAPGAEILVYFAPNNDKGFLDAIKKAVTDPANSATVLAITWGGPESTWTSQAAAAMDSIFHLAATQGITVLIASGDSGVTDGVTDGRAHADFPATSPWVLACGGTRIEVAGNRITSEVVWNDVMGGATGGGVSALFPKPVWQGDVKVPVDSNGHTGRGIPDVAIDASPTSGYAVFIDGHKTVIGGTAAATPLWAGLIALINQGLGRDVGYINPDLYTKIGPAGVLRPITQGDNSVGDAKGYAAGPGWNAVTGWGSPDGKKLLEAFRRLGSPQR